jgi:16S rRNA G1207 methylase RsmC
VVWAVDVNDRALRLTARNAATLGLPAVRAVRPDEVPPSVRFAGVWSNPPIRIGKIALHELLDLWLPRLDAGGTAWMVVHRHLGGDSLAAWLGGEGWTVNRAASKRGYRILEVSRP